jgi:hypothetical protein
VEICVDDSVSRIYKELGPKPNVIKCNPTCEAERQLNSEKFACTATVTTMFCSGYYPVSTSAHFT